MLENRSKLIFGSCVVIAGVIFFQMGMYALHVLLGWGLDYNVIQFCTSLVRKLGLASVGYVLDVLVFYTIFLSVWITAKQLFLSHKAYQRITVYRHEQLTIEINQQYAAGKHHITVMCHPEPIAFTMGFLKPKIILSTGLLQLLDKTELDAVILHELYHQKHGDPVKTFVLHLLATVMWYLPIINCLMQKYKMIRELLADQYAVNEQGTPTHVGSALLKLLKKGQATPLPFSHVSFADTSINYRIKQLLDPQTNIPLTFPLKQTVISLQMLLLLCGSFAIVLS